MSLKLRTLELPDMGIGEHSFSLKLKISGIIAEERRRNYAFKIIDF